MFPQRLNVTETKNYNTVISSVMDSAKCAFQSITEIMEGNKRHQIDEVTTVATHEYALCYNSKINV